MCVIDPYTETRIINVPTTEGWEVAASFISSLNSASMPSNRCWYMYAMGL